MNLLARLPFLAATLLCFSSLAHAQEDIQHYEEARIAFEEQAFQQSLIHLKNALQANPDHIPARILLAQVYLNQGDVYSAEKEAGEALLLGADINLVLPIYGTSLLLQQKTRELLEIEQYYDQLTPDNRFEWHLLKGQALVAQGEDERGVSEFEKALAARPVDVRANNTLAWAYSGLERYEDAEALIQTSLELDPNNPKTLQLRGQISAQRGNLDEALRYFEQAHDLAPDDPKVLRSIARTHLDQGNLPELRRTLDLILQSSPDDPAATLLSAMLMVSENGEEMADAEAMLKHLSNQLTHLEETGFQGSDNILFIRASADYVQRNDESARSLLNTYLKKHRGDLAAMRMLTDVYLRNGDRKRAKELLSTRRQYVLDDFGLTLQLIYLYLDQRDILGAQETLAEVKKRAPGHPRVVMLEAEYLTARGQPESALALINGHDFGADEPIDYGLLRGELELSLKRFNAAMSNVRRLEEKAPTNIAVINFGSVTYLTMGRWNQAEVYVDKALALDPENTNARFNKAYLEKARGNLDAAEKILNGILNQQPEHVNAILLTARVAFDRGDYDQAIMISKRALNYDVNSLKPAELQLEVYKATGNKDKVLETALKLTKQDRLNTHYMVELAEAYIQLKDFEQAQRPLNKLYALWEQQPAQLRQLARLQARSQNLSAARKSLETARQQDVRNLELRLDLARLSLLEGDLLSVSTSVAELETEFGQRAEIELLRGELALAEGDKAAAQNAFFTAHQLEPENTRTLVSLYNLAQEGVGANEFTTLLESVLKAGGQPTWVRKLLADTYLTQGKYDDAARHYEVLLAVPGLEADAGILNNLANVYARNDLDRALKTAQLGLSTNGENNWALLDTIGWILTQLGRHEEALPYLREAYALNSTSPEVRYHTGVTLLALGRKEEAEKELRAALVLGDSFPGAAEARNTLQTLSGVKI